MIEKALRLVSDELPAQLSPVFAEAIALIKSGDAKVRTEDWWQKRQDQSINAWYESGEARLVDAWGTYLGAGFRGGKLVLAYSGHTEGFVGQVVAGHLVNISLAQYRGISKCLHYFQAQACDRVLYFPALLLSKDTPQDTHNRQLMLVAEWWSVPLLGLVPDQQRGRRAVRRIWPAESGRRRRRQLDGRHRTA